MFALQLQSAFGYEPNEYRLEDDLLSKLDKSIYHRKGNKTKLGTKKIE